MVFDTSELLKVQTFLLNEYTHSTFDHIWGNVKLYLITLLVIFAFEDNKKRFWIMAASSFLIAPIIAAFLTKIFWTLINQNTVSQGFSGINAAFLAYSLMVFVIWALHDVLPIFNQSNIFKGWQWFGYILMCMAVAITFALIIFYGLQLGIFVGGGYFVSNGIAHFGGFMTGLIVFLLCDLIPKNRNLNFDIIFIMAIIMGFIIYIPYLAKVIEGIKGG